MNNEAPGPDDAPRSALLGALVADAELLAGRHVERAAVGKTEFQEKGAWAGIGFHGGEDFLQGGFIKALVGEAESDGADGGFFF
jgi:hypothetical protein